MSWEASTHALGIKVGSATRKLILMGYANHASKDGTAAFPSVKTVAEYAECDVRTAQRHVKWLVEHGYMREGDQELVSHYAAGKRPIVYDVAMNEAERAEWEAYHAAGANALRGAATAAGEKGVAAKAQVKTGDNLSPQQGVSNGPDSTGDNLSPQGTGDRGDNSDQAGVTNQPGRGDTGVTQTTQVTSQEANHPSSAAAAATAAVDEPIVLTEQERETGRDAEGQALKGKRLEALAQEVSKAWWDWIEPNGHAKPAQSFIACKGIIRAALANGVPPKDVKRGLAKITGEGRAVTGASLQIAIQATSPAAELAAATPRRGDIDWNAATAKAQEMTRMLEGGAG